VHTEIRVLLWIFFAFHSLAGCSCILENAVNASSCAWHEAAQSFPCTRKLFSSKKLPMAIAALPKPVFSLHFIPVTVYSCSVIFMNIITALLQQKLNLWNKSSWVGVSHPRSSKEAPSGSLSSNDVLCSPDPTTSYSALTMLTVCNTAPETFRDCLSDTASVSSAQAANLAADRARVRKPRERRYPLGCKWQGTKRCGSCFMSTGGNLEHSQKKKRLPLGILKSAEKLSC